MLSTATAHALMGVEPLPNIYAATAGKFIRAHSENLVGC